jgi:hypothetical protein
MLNDCGWKDSCLQMNLSGLPDLHSILIQRELDGRGRQFSYEMASFHPIECGNYGLRVLKATFPGHRSPRPAISEAQLIKIPKEDNV